jgi:hypothetical protein
MPKQPPIKAQYIALLCVLAVAVLFAGSIIISVAVVQAERAAPVSPSDSQ